ncbi:MAG: hypothetical protein AAGE84_01145 [Cyanobacteria bacterium P01_G01_bin.39]
MSEANQNHNFGDLESMLSNQSDSSDYWRDDYTEEQNQMAEAVGKSRVNNSDSETKTASELVLEQNTSSSIKANKESVTQKMNWQKVAHKLREYNRKLLKKVFRLEQELAEIDNKFNKYVEKSQNSDILLAHQAEEIKKYQEQITLLTQQLATSQQHVEQQNLLNKKISEQQQFSQQQTAQLERECTLLQEKYTRQAYELTTKEQENDQLRIQLNQQQQHTLEQEAELKKYQAAALRKEKATSNQKNYPHNRYIQPWSTSTIAEPKIALPRKSQPAKFERTHSPTSDTIKTAAEIATRSASTLPNQKTEKSQPVKPPRSKKPQSLAAVDLPTFPRPQ